MVVNLVCATHMHMQLALSASSPIFRGYLADIDCRWPVISGSVDDRTDEERGVKVSEFNGLKYRHIHVFCMDQFLATCKS